MVLDVWICPLMKHLCCICNKNILVGETTAVISPSPAMMLFGLWQMRFRYLFRVTFLDGATGHRELWNLYPHSTPLVFNGESCWLNSKHSLTCPDKRQQCPSHDARSYDLHCCRCTVFDVENVSYARLDLFTTASASQVTPAQNRSRPQARPAHSTPLRSRHFHCRSELQIRSAHSTRHPRVRSAPDRPPPPLSRGRPSRRGPASAQSATRRYRST